jgi:phage tail P2-like protein
MADNRLIPDSIRDKSTEAFNALIDRLGTLDLTPLLVYIIDNVSASALPHLAGQFGLLGDEGWLITQTDQARRDLLKNAIEKKRYKGTKYGLTLALQSLGLSVTVKEWFEYSGQPYHFKVTIDNSTLEITSQTLARLDRFITEYKNLRSVADVIDINLQVNGEVPVYAIGLQSSEIITVYPQ